MKEYLYFKVYKNGEIETIDNSPIKIINDKKMNIYIFGINIKGIEFID